MQYKFHLNNLRIAPRKVRRVIALIKGLPVEEAEIQLKFQSKRSALPILKLLKSGVASAINNFSLSPDSLYVANIFVDEGQTLKRFRPRAFGRAGVIHKKTSHITLILGEKTPSAKKAKKKVVKKVKTESKEAIEKREMVIEKKSSVVPKEIKPKGRFEGITRRIFRRKAIG